MKQKEKSEFQDDNRTIADMNVEGMRWHDRKYHRTGPAHTQPLKLSKKERRALLKASMRMALTLALVIVGIFLLVLLILRFLWIR